MRLVQRIGLALRKGLRLEQGTLGLGHGLRLGQGTSLGLGHGLRLGHGCPPDIQQD